MPESTWATTNEVVTMRHILEEKTPGWLLLLAALIWVAGAG